MKWQQGIEDYMAYLRIERGLSENSIANYALDLKRLVSWLSTNNDTANPITIRQEQVQQFVYEFLILL